MLCGLFLVVGETHSHYSIVGPDLGLTIKTKHYSDDDIYMYIYVVWSFFLFFGGERNSQLLFEGVHWYSQTRFRIDNNKNKTLI